MKSAIAIVIVAAALATLVGVVLSARSRAKGAAGGSARGAARGGTAARGELVAVLAAAVAAASGMGTDSFRILGITPSAPSAGPSGEAWRRGINTPAWGHVDRFIRGE